MMIWKYVFYVQLTFYTFVNRNYYNYEKNNYLQSLIILWKRDFNYTEFIEFPMLDIPSIDFLHGLK